MSKVQPFLTGNGDQRRTLVVIFLRGGADGLSLVAPLEDSGYYKARPRIAVSKHDAIHLDGFYGLHPLMKSLAPLYKDGALAIVHAVGSEDTTRSHFEAQDLMEHGGTVAGGWLGRFLRNRPNAMAGPLSAVALGRTVPECLRGAPAATVMESFEDFSLGSNSLLLTGQLARLYGSEPGLLGQAGRDTLEALHRIQKLRNTPYHPAHGADYGRDEFSKGLQQVARMIKARVGLEAASVDLNGWDSHFAQSTLIEPRMVQLASGLFAFYTDLGREIEHTTVVVMTEFGRRVAENSAFGTDHGRGGVMFALGGGIQGGRVYGRWPGLNEDVLEGPGDLPVTTNYRDVLAPILGRFGAKDKLPQIFPQHELKPVPLYG